MLLILTQYGSLIVYPMVKRTRTYPAPLGLKLGNKDWTMAGRPSEGARLYFHFYLTNKRRTDPARHKQTSI